MLSEDGTGKSEARDRPGGQQPIARSARQQSLPDWWKTDAFTKPRDAPTPPRPRPAAQSRPHTSGGDVTRFRAAVASLDAVHDAVPGGKEEGSYSLGLRKQLEEMQKAEARKRQERQKAAEQGARSDAGAEGPLFTEGASFVNFESHQSLFKRAVRTLSTPFTKPTNPASTSSNPPPPQAPGATRGR
ncbi:hypothetical protein GCM10017779_68680 [Streptomyces capillispiralis]|nr:hypothetical protein GCM10017779_68680 [Streptomyces capillispiralis]